MNAIDLNATLNPKKIPRILVIDDDPAMQRLIAEHINNQNMRAIIASDQRTMLSAMAAREPDLVILDLHLGSDDGLDLLRNPWNCLAEKSAQKRSRKTQEFL